jgi:hypothetical protein
MTPHTPTPEPGRPVLSQETLKPHRYRADQDFFTRLEVMDLIRRLALEPKLSIFLGAGASVAQGLPAWRELLHRMLMSAVKNDGRFESKKAKDQWARSIEHSYDATAAASVLRARFYGKESFRGELHRALYPLEGPQNRGSDRFARAVWDLVIQRKARGLETTIYTLNYDDSLERTFSRATELQAAAKEAGIADVAPVYSVQSLAELNENALPIYHLHGYLPREAWEDIPDHDFVLSMSDFGVDWNTHWSSSLILNSLSTQWLMVGMSFQDPHVNALLHQRRNLYSEHELKAVGIVSTQGRPWHDLQPGVATMLAEAEQTRLGDLDLLALVTSYFFQDFLFLQEMSLHVKDPHIPNYLTRRTEWHSLVTHHHSALSAPIHQRRHTKFNESLKSLRSSLESLRAPGAEDERLKVELWIRDVEERGLRLFASSEVLILEADRSPFFKLIADSPIAAIRAFTNGAPRPFDREGNAPGTWNSFLGFPVYLGGDPWWELPVGSLVVGSSLSLKSSTLETQSNDVTRMVLNALPDLCRQLKAKGLLTQH